MLNSLSGQLASAIDKALFSTLFHPSPPPAPQRQILCIDPEPDICQIVCDALGEFHGWSVTTAAGLSVLDAAPPGGWDAVLVEVSQTPQRGFPLVAALANHPSTCHSPILLLTSQVMPRDYARFQQMAVRGVIAKPFDPLLLGTHMADLLGWAS
jgi:CheY-like chemotaxis protein